MADRTSTVRVNVITDASGAGSKLAGFGRVAGAAALGVGAVAVGAAVGANKLYDYADAQDDANASIAQGIKSMGLFGKQSGDVTKRITDQATALSKATAVDVTSIKTTQAKLLTFKNLAKTADTAGGTFDRATKAAVDLAAKGFGTAETNAVQLGKALNDPVKGLTSLGKAGITFTDQEKQRIQTLVESNKLGEAQALVLKNIESQVGGTAEATAGGFELMKNRLSLFGQELATKALPYLDKFGTFMIETGGPALVKFGQAVGENVLPKIKAFAGFVQDKVLPVLQDLAGWILEHLVPAYKEVLAGALEGAKGLFKNVADSVDENREPLRDMGEKLKKVGEFLVDKVLPVMGDFYREVLPKVGDAIGIAIGFMSDMYDALNKIYDSAVKVANALQTVIDKMNQVKGAGGVGTKGAPGSTIPGNTPSGNGSQDTSGLRVTINVPGGFIGDEVALASKIEQVLRDNRLRFNGLVTT